MTVPGRRAREADARFEPPARPYRGALIGLGGIAKSAHLPAFAGDPAVRDRLRVVAAVDGASHVEPVDGLVHLDRRDALRAHGPIDFVDICTPTSSHLELTLWALEQGYHVLCEKPVAVTRAEADAIREAARRARRVVMPCHQYRFNPVWRRIGQWLAEGAIGRWHLAELYVYRTVADRGTTPGELPWRGQRADARGGILLDHGTHLIYQLMDSAGVPERVRAFTAQLRHLEYDVEDTAQIIFEYPERLGVLFMTWAAHHRENRVRFVGEAGSIEWIGGTLTLDRAGTVETFDYRAELDKSRYASWFSALFRSFADAIDQQDGAESLDDIANVAAVVEAAYESARTGCVARVR